MQVAQAIKIEPRNVRITVIAKYFRDGSVIQGTAMATCDGIRTELALESDEPPERVAHLIRMAEANCYAMAAIRGIAPCELASTVNGQPFDATARSRPLATGPHPGDRLPPRPGGDHDLDSHDPGRRGHRRAESVI